MRERAKADMKDSFVLYTKIIEMVSMLSNEQKGVLFQAILDYETGNEVNISDFAVELAFVPIKQDLDRNDEKWEQTRIKRSEAGKKGGLAKSSNAKQTLANVANAKIAKQKVANVAVNEYVNVNVNENVNENGINNKKEKVKRKKTTTVEDSRIGKEQFADEVYLTEDEYLKLVSEFGQSGASRMIDILDSYKGANGKTYLSDYKAIRNWVVGRYKEEQARAQREQPRSLADKWGVRTDDF